MEVTYGVSGMMEWVALIPSGRNIVRVRFSGGSLTGFGVSPATFKTSNPVVMKMIEGSSYFRSGKIRIVDRKGEEKSGTSASADYHSEGDASIQYGCDGEVTFSKERR